jgi:hypothetical protein
VKGEGPPSCPESFAVCLDAKNGLALVRNLEAYRRWVQEAWERCGASTAPGSSSSRR